MSTTTRLQPTACNALSLPPQRLLPNFTYDAPHRTSVVPAITGVAASRAYDGPCRHVMTTGTGTTTAHFFAPPSQTPVESPAETVVPIAGNPINRTDASGLAWVGHFSLAAVVVKPKIKGIPGPGYQVAYFEDGYVLPAGHRIVLVQALQNSIKLNILTPSAHIDDDMGVGNAINKTTSGGINPTAYLDMTGLKGAWPNSFQDRPLGAFDTWYLSVVAIDRADGGSWKTATRKCAAPDKILGAINFSFDSGTGAVTHDGMTIKAGSITPIAAEAPNVIWDRAKALWDSDRGP